MIEPNLIIKKITEDRIWKFKGGLHLNGNKIQSNHKAIEPMSIAPIFYVPVIQHSGMPADLLVKVGDYVLKGQPLTLDDNLRKLPVHSPTSGLVVDIKPHFSTHASAIETLTIFIESDGKDLAYEQNKISDFTTLSFDEIERKIYQAGIAGLGGAGFPSAFKMNLANKSNCNVLIINAVECEPYISCDDRMMQDLTSDFIKGIEILNYILQPKATVIAVENNKPQAIAKLKETLNNREDILLKVLPEVFPSGASNQLFKILTGLEIPLGKHTTDFGVLMYNVGTIVAIKKAVIDDAPLFERVVTVTGNKIPNKGNYLIRIGTPISYVLEKLGYVSEPNLPVFVGGPLTGFMLKTIDTPIIKTVNCVFAPDFKEYQPPKPERACIRCSTCAEACPVDLLPQQLYWFAKSENHEKSKSYHLNSCIECGICAVVCPSHIPLVQYFRQEKFKIAEIELKAKKAKEAKIRFEAREKRIAKEKLEREQRMQALANQRREEIAQKGGLDPVAAALARIKAKQAQATEQKVTETGEPDNKDLIQERRKRREAKAETTQIELTPAQKAKQLALQKALAKAKEKQINSNNAE